jgi:hypothetical protein
MSREAGSFFIKEVGELGTRHSSTQACPARLLFNKRSREARDSARKNDSGREPGRLGINEPRGRVTESPGMPSSAALEKEAGEPGTRLEFGPGARGTGHR